MFLFSFSIPSSPKVFSFYDFSLFCCCCIFLLGCKKPCTGLISHFWTKQQLVMQCQLVFCFCGCIQWRLRVAYSVVIMCFTKQHRLAVQISKVPFFFPSFWSGPLAIAVVPHYVNNSIHRNVLHNSCTGLTCVYKQPETAAGLSVWQASASGNRTGTRPWK